MYLNQQKIQLTWHPGERLETFEVGLSLDLLHQLLPLQHTLYSRLIKSRERNIAAPINTYNLPLPASIRQILFDILHCQLTPVFKQMYIKAKIIELLALQSEHYEDLLVNNDREYNGHYLKKSEIEKMHLVKDIIHEKFDQPCSLIDLAHQVGTNETYLKQHFKKVFGDTVFGYLQQVKMNKAKDMLLNGKTVQEVAGKMGYKHAAHFTRAFKKHIGYQPRKIKQFDRIIL